MSPNHQLTGFDPKWVPEYVFNGYLHYIDDENHEHFTDDPWRAVAFTGYQEAIDFIKEEQIETFTPVRYYFEKAQEEKE